MYKADASVCCHWPVKNVEKLSSTAGWMDQRGVVPANATLAGLSDVRNPLFDTNQTKGACHSTSGGAEDED